MNKIIRRFETFNDFLEAALVVPKKQDSSSSRRIDDGRNPWSGTKTFEEAVELAKRGWAEGASKALQFRACIADAVREIITSRSTSYAWDVAGQFIDIGRYLEGEPECFGTLDEAGQTAAQPVVKIFVNLAASGSVSVESLFARGAVILAAIDVLEATGKRVEVVAAKGSRGNTIHETYVTVKRPDQPVDADRLAFVLAHAGCLRRLFFSVMEQKGHLPNSTWPHEIVVEEEGAIVTRHALRGHDFSKYELLQEVAVICGQAGVEIPQEEIERLAAA